MDMKATCTKLTVINSAIQLYFKKILEAQILQADYELCDLLMSSTLCNWVKLHIGVGSGRAGRASALPIFS